MICRAVLSRALLAAAALMPPALAQEAPPNQSNAPTEAPTTDESYSIHGQLTNVTQYHPSFNSPYRGPNSLDPGNRGDETVDLTLFAGARLWEGGEAYANPEVDQGFGLSNTLGVAGFPSGEAYKIGSATPYARLPRAFFRQTIDLGGESQPVDPTPNQLGGARDADNIVMTAGKFAVTDIFDTNSYAHDPRGDFLNWSLIDAGAFDYAADPWGYTYGEAIEWTQSWWTIREGVFDLSRVPNSKALERGFGQFEAVAEIEERHDLLGRAGKLKILGFVNDGKMGKYQDAIRAAAGTGMPPSTAAVRRFQARAGGEVNFEQELTDSVGLFLRASANDGSKETYEFTEINGSVSGGLSLKGKAWERPDDMFGIAGVVNAISGDAQKYFALGGLGILIGDGRLPRYAPENIAEAYYNLAMVEGITLGLDYQFIENPAYNPERGPVSVLGARIHAEF